MTHGHGDQHSGVAADQYARGNEPQCRDQFAPERPRAWSEAELADVRRNLVAGASVSAMKSIERTAITNNTKSTVAILHLPVKATAALPRVAIIVVGGQAAMYPRSLSIPVVLLALYCVAVIDQPGALNGTGRLAQREGVTTAQTCAVYWRISARY